MEANMLKRVIAIIVLVSFVTGVGGGCYNRYYVPMGELQKLQSSETGTATVQDEKNRVVTVKETDRLAVRSVGGKRYPLTPFNFQLTESQLVASDRDYILDLNSLRPQAEVEHLSKWQTATLVTIGVLAIGGVLGWAVYSAVSSKASEQTQ
jgi:hypothetical protein